MTITKLAATLAVIAASTIAPSVATAARPHMKNEISIETLESTAVFSGDAYDNEMGVQTPYWLPEVGDEVS